jgi:hypothetical protein
MNSLTWPEWAERIWPVLTGAARYRRTIEYTILTDWIGFEGLPQWLSDTLGRIAEYCHRNGWPILPVLVIKQSGHPGPGIPYVQDDIAERERIFNFDWYKQRPVRPDDFQVSACLSGNN